MMPNKHIAEIILFGMSGVAGFIVDGSIVVLITKVLGLGPDHCIQCSSLCHLDYQSSLGAVINNGLYVILIFTIALFLKDPVFSVTAGSIAGMGFNFVSSKLVVFNTPEL